MTRTGSAVISWVKARYSWHPSGMCQQFSRSAFDVGAYYGTASLAWHSAKKRHPVTHGSQVPAAVPVFWTGGSHGYGHVAVSLGNGYCRSTDWPRRYSVGTARIDDISRAWGHQLAGWTEDINRVTVYHNAPASGPNVIDLSNVIAAAKAHSSIKNGVRLKKAVAAEVGKGSMNLGNGALGHGFGVQYKLVQTEYFKAIKRTPGRGDVDGIPGTSSLTWLGKRHGFTVRY